MRARHVGPSWVPFAPRISLLDSVAAAQQCPLLSSSSNGEDDVEYGGTPRTTKQISLPKYRNRHVLAKGEVLLEFDQFIEETAHHILANSDMTSKSDYEEYGKRLILKYPCLEFPGRKHYWVTKHA